MSPTLPRAVHPAAWWGWAVGMAVAVSTTNNPLLLFLALEVVALVVANRRGSSPWARAFRLYLWLGLFTSHPGALASGRTYLHIVGPVYGFFGLAMALYFASQGTGEMVWPVVANLCRILIAVCGSLLALDVLGWGLQGLFVFVALGIVSFSAVLAFSTTRPAWRPQS